MKMKELEKRIEYKGFVYLQEYRDEKYAIYSQWLDNDLIAYELIKIRKNKEFERFGKSYGACESYPTDREWGDSGWTFKTLKEAEKRLSEYKSKLSKLATSKSVEAL